MKTSEMLKVIPRFPSRNLAESIAFYEQKLGFTCVIDLDDYAEAWRAIILSLTFG